MVRRAGVGQCLEQLGLDSDIQLSHARLQKSELHKLDGLIPAASVPSLPFMHGKLDRNGTPAFGNGDGHNPVVDQKPCVPLAMILDLLYVASAQKVCDHALGDLFLRGQCYAFLSHSGPWRT